MSIPKSHKNRLHNVSNPYQGPYQRVLCVCSAGLLRSPTLAEVLRDACHFNTRAVGSSREYALIPIDDALITWADQIIFVSQENYDEVCKDEYLKSLLLKKDVMILGVEDSFEFRDPELKKILLEAYLTKTS